MGAIPRRMRLQKIKLSCTGERLPSEGDHNGLLTSNVEITLRKGEIFVPHNWLPRS
jgi:hypothetical protein